MGTLYTILVQSGNYISVSTFDRLLSTSVIMPAATPSSEFVFPNDQPVVALDAGSAFKVGKSGEEYYCTYRYATTLYVKELI